MCTTEHTDTHRPRYASHDVCSYRPHLALLAVLEMRAKMISDNITDTPGYMAQYETLSALKQQNTYIRADSFPSIVVESTQRRRLTMLGS